MLKNKSKKLILLITFTIIILGIYQFKSNFKYENNLYTPTQIQKYGDTYFIVDCWHSRIIYNSNLEDKIKKWKVLSDDIIGPHSIASDGELFVVEDTERNMVKVFKKSDSKFYLNQQIENIGGRPHKVIYDEDTKLFYVITSQSQEIIALENNNGKLSVKYKKKLNFLEDSYIRSINIIDDRMYFVSGPGKITSAHYKDGSFNVDKIYKVSEELYGMNDIIKIDNYYYVTIYTNQLVEIKPKILRTDNLKTLQNNKYEDLYKKLGFKGTPYYFSFIDNKIFITEIDGNSSIKSFNLNDGEIVDVITYHNSGKPNKASLNRKNYMFNNKELICNTKC